MYKLERVLLHSSLDILNQRELKGSEYHRIWCATLFAFMYKTGVLLCRAEGPISKTYFSDSIALLGHT